MKLSKLIPLTNSSIQDEMKKTKESPTYFIERYCKVLRNPGDGKPYVNEGLIKTVPLDKAIKIFNRVLKPKFDNKFQVNVNGDDNDYYKTTLLIFKVPKIPQNISHLTFGLERKE